MRLSKKDFIRIFGEKALEPEKKPKYRNQKCEWGGKSFPSFKERDRYIELCDRQKRGELSNLRTQVKFRLSPPVYEDGKCVERACDYVADFVYTENGQTVVEDTKGFRTKEYIIKRKWMLEKYGIRIKET